MSDENTLRWCQLSQLSAERLCANQEAIREVVRNNCPGDIVECGVYQGGSVMTMASTLLELNDLRTIWLYDTFTGMTPPEAIDIDLHGKFGGHYEGANVADLNDVKACVGQAGYPEDRLVWVKGDVIQTLTTTVPDRIAVLRLDTDWYASTYAELKYLYPLLSKGGILMIDDYGHWQGCKKAVDDYFEEQGIDPELEEIDYSGRLHRKP